MAVNPVETSGVRCEQPKKHHKKKMSSLKADTLKCEYSCQRVSAVVCRIYLDIVNWVTG